MSPRSVRTASPSGTPVPYHIPRFRRPDTYFGPWDRCVPVIVEGQPLRLGCSVLMEEYLVEQVNFTVTDNLVLVSDPRVRYCKHVGLKLERSLAIPFRGRPEDGLAVGSWEQYERWVRGGPPPVTAHSERVEAERGSPVTFEVVLLPEEHTPDGPVMAICPTAQQLHRNAAEAVVSLVVEAQSSTTRVGLVFDWPDFYTDKRVQAFCKMLVESITDSDPALLCALVDDYPTVWSQSPLCGVYRLLLLADGAISVGRDLRQSGVSFVSVDGVVYSVRDDAVADAEAVLQHVRMQHGQEVEASLLAAAKGKGSLDSWSSDSTGHGASDSGQQATLEFLAEAMAVAMYPDQDDLAESPLAQLEALKRKQQSRTDYVKPCGQIWEPCPKCGREPVYMPLFVCDHCWPQDPSDN